MLISHLITCALRRKAPSWRSLLLQQYKMAKQISTSPVCSCDSLRSSKMALIKPVSHVIFDMDGLLLDTVPLYQVLRQEILTEFGVKYDLQSNFSSQGLLSTEVAKSMIEEYNLPISLEEYLQRSARLAPTIFANAKLLPDTEVIYEKIIGQITASYGKEYTPEIRLKVLGTTEQLTGKLVVELCGLPISVDEFLQKFRAVQVQELGKAGLMKGAERLVRHLHKNKVPIAVATSSGKESVAVKTKNHEEIFSLFHHTVMGSSDPEVKNGKPAPDIFIVCASRFEDKPPCEKCLVFEDAPNGVTGAVAAGMQTVMVPDEELPEDRTKHATVVLKSLCDFKPELFGLPAF